MATYPDLHWFRHSALPMIKSTTKWLLLAIITRKKRQALAFSHYRLPHLLRPPENKTQDAHSQKKKDLLLPLILNSEILPDMMLYSLTLPALLITLLCFYLDSSAGSCMPCHKPNRRDTPWDHSFSTRGLCIPKITSPTKNTIWIIGSDVAVTW